MADAKSMTNLLLNAGTSPTAFSAAFKSVSATAGLDARTLSRIAHDYAGSGVGKRAEFATREAALASIRATFDRARDHEASVNKARQERIAARQAMQATRSGRQAAPGFMAIRAAGPNRLGDGLIAAKVTAAAGGGGSGGDSGR